MCDLHNVTAWFHKSFGLCKINFQQMWWMASSPSIFSDNKPPHLSSWLGCSWMRSMLTHASFPPPGAPVMRAGGLTRNVRVVAWLQREIRWAGFHDQRVLGQRPQKTSNLTFYDLHPGCGSRQNNRNSAWRRRHYVSEKIPEKTENKSEQMNRIKSQNVSQGYCILCFWCLNYPNIK